LDGGNPGKHNNIVKGIFAGHIVTCDIIADAAGRAQPVE
jgi:hypothetical protein